MTNNKIKSSIPLGLVTAADRLSLLFRFFFKRKRLNSNTSKAHPFFIIGSGRSGNTLLRSLLVSGGEVCIPPESYVLPRVIRTYSSYNFLEWEKLSALVIAEFEAFKEFYTWETNLAKAHQKARELPPADRNLAEIINCVYSTYQEQINQKNRFWGDKTPVNTFFLDKIVKVFPKAKYVHILREPKDVAVSSVKAGIYQNHHQAAENWNLFIKKVIWARKKLPRDQFHQVRYEELVSQPETELKKIADFLGIDYNTNMLDFYKITDKLGDVKHWDHHSNLNRQLNTDSVGKWRKKLSDQEAREVDEITEKTRRKIGL